MFRRGLGNRCITGLEVCRRWGYQRHPHAGVVKLVDARDSKSRSARSVGSTPTTRTTGLSQRAGPYSALTYLPFGPGLDPGLSKPALCGRWRRLRRGTLRQAQGERGGVPAQTLRLGQFQRLADLEPHGFGGIQLLRNLGVLLRQIGGR